MKAGVIMWILAIVTIIVIVSLVIKSKIDATDKAKAEKVREAAAYLERIRNALRSNEIFQRVVTICCYHLSQICEKAQNEPFTYGMHDYFVVNLCKNKIYFRKGIIAGDLPHVSASEDYHYFTYNVHFDVCLEHLEVIDLQNEGYANFQGSERRFFAMVLTEEIGKAGYPTRNESYYDYDNPESDCMLIWDLAHLHPEKKLKSII